MKILKKSLSFFVGALTATVLIALSGSALAATESILYNQAGIALFGNVKVEAGTVYKAPNGQEVPSVITYIDAAGGKTNYLSVRQISELLDAEVSWNAETGNVDLALLVKGDLASARRKLPRLFRFMELLRGLLQKLTPIPLIPKNPP